MPSPITTIILAFAMTISLTEDSIGYGIGFFLFALVNELLRAWARRGIVVGTDE